MKRKVKAKPKSKKRQKLGTGYLWFGGPHNLGGYTEVLLTTGPHGRGTRTVLKIGGLGAWKKVSLFAEWR